MEKTDFWRTEITCSQNSGLHLFLHCFWCNTEYPVYSSEKGLNARVSAVLQMSSSPLHCSYRCTYTHLLTLNIQAQETHEASDLKNKVYEHSHSSKQGERANCWHRRQCSWRKWPSLLGELPSPRNAWAFSRQTSSLSGSLIAGQRACIFRAKETAHTSLATAAIFDLFISTEAVQRSD